MFLAFSEMRRARARFGLLIAAVALLFFLILTQQGLQSGLITSFVGAIERQSAPVLVYSVDGQRTLQGSVIPPPLEEAIARVDGVAGAARLGQGTFTVSVEGDDASDAALIGYEVDDLGGPEGPSAGRLAASAGEAVGSSADFALGDEVRLVEGEGGPVLTVVGLVDDAQIQVTPTLFVAWDDYEAATRAANPDAAVVLPNVIAVRPVDGITPEELTTRIERANEDAEALTRQQAADESPGVAQVRSSFQVILLLFGLVVPLVTGLFFLIITFQKARALTLLRAIGAPAPVLVRSLIVQVVVVIGGGALIGTLLYAPLSRVEVGAITLPFDAGTITIWALLLLGLGLLSAAVAARRVLAIDPVEATSGGGVR